MGKWVSNLVFKFRNDPIVNESEIVVLLLYVWVYVGEKEGFRKEGRKNELERKESKNIS